MHISRSTRINTLVFIFFLILIPAAKQLLGSSGAAFNNDSFEYSCLIVIWILTLQWRLTDKRTRRMLVGISLFMLLFMALRMARNDLVADYEELARQMWYVYYVPMLFISYESFRLTFNYGMGRGERAKFVKPVFLAVTAILSVFIITNDFHGLFFRVGADTDSVYSYGIVYYLAVVWMILLFAGVCFIIKRYFYDYSSGEGIFTVVFAATAVFSVGLVTRLLFPSLLILQTPEIFCFTVMAFWEAAIQSGIIISNSGYGDVFRNSGFNAVIYDSKGRAVYSAGGAELPEKDRIVHPVFIRGGCLVYNEDISELNRVNEALEETSDSLEEEQAALIASNRLREEEEQIKAKNLIYDAIAGAVVSQSAEIADLARQAEENPDLFNKNLSLICFYGSYIKRRANLALSGQENGEISSAEILLAFDEIFYHLSLCGVHVSVSGSATGSADAAAVIAAVDSVQHITESVVDSLKGVIINVFETGDKIRIRAAFEADGKPSLPSEPGITARSFREDDAEYINIEVEKRCAL